MDAWRWDDQWTLEVEELDAQHAGIMVLWERVRNELPKARLAAWRELAAGMRTHFEFEDRWMESVDFAHKRHHMRDHRAFLAEMDAIQEDAEANFPVEDDVVQAVRGWLNGHVRGLDQDFARFLQERDAWHLKTDWEIEEFERRSAALSPA